MACPIDHLLGEREQSRRTSLHPLFLGGVYPYRFSRGSQLWALPGAGSIPATIMPRCGEKPALVLPAFPPPLLPPIPRPASARSVASGSSCS